MNYYLPSNTTSKANWVLKAIAQSDNNATFDNNILCETGVFWGLGNNNFRRLREFQSKNLNFYFTDMPYFNRFMGNNRDNCYWRVIPNALHCNWVEDLPNDRFVKLGIKDCDWRKNGSHILLCPSSNTIQKFYNDEHWLERIQLELKKYTDRPIKIRHKPRANGTSGPRAASIPIEADLKNAWAVVTSVSIAGVDAACQGIPVFCSEYSPCAALGNLYISNIESPMLVEKTKWLNTLAYYQYTEDELKTKNDFILCKPKK